MTLRVCIANPAFIGDVLFSSRMCDALVKSDPSVQILFVAKPPAHQLAKHFPGVAEVLSFDKRGAHRGLSGVRTIATQIRQFQPDIFITPHRGWRMAFLANLLGRRVRKVGFKGFWKFLYDDNAEYRKTDGFFAKEAALLAAIGVSDNGTTMRCGQRWLPEEPRCVIIAPGANWATKRWPSRSYAELAQAFIDAKWHVTLTGGPAEQAICEAIESSVPNCVNNCGESLEAAMAQMQKAALVVANDSGLAHLARAVGVPAAIIFGPTPTDVHAFSQDKHSKVIKNSIDCAPCSAHGDTVCPKGHHKCMLDLSVEYVFKEAADLVAIQRN